MKLLLWKWRKYPIKRNEDGRSLRRQAFALFDNGYRPAQVYKQQLVAASQKTLFRYFEAWKEKGHKVPYSHIKKLMKQNPEFSEHVIKMLADYFGVHAEQVILRMQRPWGLMQLLKAEFPNERIRRSRIKIEQRLEAALRLTLFAEYFGGKEPEVMKKEINRLIFESNRDSKQDR